MSSSRGEFLKSGLVATGAAIAGTPALALAQTLAEAAPPQTLNVRDFGARGDGSTLDHDAIQRAVSAGATRSAVIHLPAGRYRIAKPIVWPSGGSVSIRGDGIDRTTIVGGAQSTASLTVQAAPGTRITNLEVSDLTLDLDHTQGAMGIRYHLVSNFAARRVRFVNSAYKFIGTQLPQPESQWSSRDNEHVTFEDCIFEHHRSMRYETVTISNTDNLTFRRCRWNDCQFLCVLLYQLVDHAAFIDCEFNNVIFNLPSRTGNGISLAISCSDVRVERCRFTNVAGIGVRAGAFSDHGPFGHQSVEGVTLDHCTFSRCGEGVAIQGVTSFKDSGSVVELCKNAGVKVSTTANRTGIYPPHDVRLENTIIRNNNQNGNLPLLHPGILIAPQVAGYDLQMRLVGCQIYDDQPQHTQLYGMTVDGGAGEPKTFRGISVENSRLESYGRGAQGMTLMNATIG